MKRKRRSYHVDGPPTGLWWCQKPTDRGRALLPEETFRIFCVFYERWTYIVSKRDDSDLSLSERWRLVCADFIARKPDAQGSPETTEKIIDLVTTADKRGEFLTLEGAAMKLRLKPAHVYYWFRRLDKIARELYPFQYGSCPDTKPTVTVTEAMKQKICTQYAEGVSVKDIAKKWGVPKFRVGQIVKAEKKLHPERFPAPEVSDIY